MKLGGIRMNTNLSLKALEAPLNTEVSVCLPHCVRAPVAATVASLHQGAIDVATKSVVVSIDTSVNETIVTIVIID